MTTIEQELAKAKRVADMRARHVNDWREMYERHISDYRRTIDEDVAELDRLRNQNRQLRNGLGVLRDCVTNIECDCLDPPSDRKLDPADPSNHSQYCHIYLEAYIIALLEDKPLPD